MHTIFVKLRLKYGSPLKYLHEREEILPLATSLIRTLRVGRAESASDPGAKAEASEK